MEEIMKDVSEKLRTILEERNIDGLEIAKLCNKSSAWISEILNYRKYKKSIRVPDLVRIVNHLNIDIAELLPIPKKIDIERMSLIDLVRLIARNECEKYLKENNLLK